MKKQSGFTLIELMVVMAIIAILATAGLSAYTGYIKKARDSTRMSDLKAIESILLASLSTTGNPPKTASDLHTLIMDMNNGKGLYDPLANQTDGSGVKTVCPLSDANKTTMYKCAYGYQICDRGMGYRIFAKFESVSNLPLLLSDNLNTNQDALLFELGNCQTPCGTSAEPSYCGNDIEIGLRQIVATLNVSY